MAAGMAAYLFSVDYYQKTLFNGGLSKVPTNMMSLMKTLAFKRGSGTELVIYNGWKESSGGQDGCGSGSPVPSVAAPSMTTTPVLRRRKACGNPYLYLISS